MRDAELLTLAELDFVCEQLGSDELPYPIAVRSFGATMHDRAALRTRVLTQLAERGLVDGFGRPEPRLEQVFTVLTRAELSLDAVHLDSPESEPTLALAASLGGQGVLAVQDRSGLWLSSVPADGLASAVLELFQPITRGSERSVSVPLEELVSAHGVDFMQRRARGNGTAEPGGRGGVRADDDRKTLARLHAQPRERGGQLGVNARSRTGSRTRLPVLSWFDTVGGCYFTQAGSGPDGRDWITVAPADAATLRSRLNEMLEAATGRTATI